MDCFALRPSPSASSSVLSSHPRPPPPPDVNSAAASTSRTHPSPAVDIRGKYENAIRSNPYREWWIRARPSNSVAFHEPPSPERLEDEEVRLPTLADVLYPNQELVNEELQRAKDCSLNRLISNFFKRSEDTTRLLLDLIISIDHARRLYRPVHAVLRDLSPFDSLSEPQINRAYDEFAQFHSHSNPFPPPDPNNLDEIRQCFFDLKIYLNRRIRKSNSKIRLICLAPTHLTLCTGTKQDLAQQNEAAKKLFGLEHELNSLVNLVKRLGNSVEDVRDSMRFGLDRGRDKHCIEEVVKQLRREQTTFLKQLDSLEKHISYCHGVVSSARCLILAEVSS